MVRRVSALSQVLKETQTGASTPSTAQPEPQSESVSTLPQNRNTEIQKNTNTAIQENGNTDIQQNGTMTTPQKRRKTDERVKLTFYLDPEDTQKFDTLRYNYNLQRGLRLDQNKFMRLIIKNLDLSILEETNQ
jgi:hypothetical protein